MAMSVARAHQRSDTDRPSRSVGGRNDLAAYTRSAKPATASGGWTIEDASIKVPKHTPASAATKPCIVTGVRDRPSVWPIDKASVSDRMVMNPAWPLRTPGNDKSSASHTHAPEARNPSPSPSDAAAVSGAARSCPPHPIREAMPVPYRCHERPA